MAKFKPIGRYFSTFNRNVFNSLNTTLEQINQKIRHLEDTCCSEKCTPLTKDAACVNNKCGTVSDGCDGSIHCMCSPTQRCYNGQCCNPKSCGEGDCGTISDGCGSTITCQNCVVTPCISDKNIITNKDWYLIRFGQSNVVLTYRFELEEDSVKSNGDVHYTVSILQKDGSWTKVTYYNLVIKPDCTFRMGTFSSGYINESLEFVSTTQYHYWSVNGDYPQPSYTKDLIIGSWREDADGRDSCNFDLEFQFESSLHFNMYFLNQNRSCINGQSQICFNPFIGTIYYQPQSNIRAQIGQWDNDNNRFVFDDGAAGSNVIWTKIS